MNICILYCYFRALGSKRLSTEWNGYRNRRWREVWIQQLSINTSEAPPKKGKVPVNEEVWFAIPEMPEDQTKEMLEEKVNQLKKIFKSTRPDHSTVQTLMTETFPIRRKVVIEGTEGLDSLLKRYPPLQNLCM